MCTCRLRSTIEGRLQVQECWSRTFGCGQRHPTLFHTSDEGKPFYFPICFWLKCFERLNISCANWNGVGSVLAEKRVRELSRRNPLTEGRRSYTAVSILILADFLSISTSTPPHECGAVIRRHGSRLDRSALNGSTSRQVRLLMDWIKCTGVAENVFFSFTAWAGGGET